MQNIAVVFGGKTVEHDISIITGLGVIKNLSAKYNILPVFIDKKGEWWTGENLKNAESYTGQFKAKKCFMLPNHPELCVKNKFSVHKTKIDCAVLTLHGGIYEGGAVESVFNLCNVPTTTAGLLGSSVCMDKVVTKLILESIDIATPKFVYGANFEEIKTEIDQKELKYPLIIKPARCGSSIGITLAKNKKDLIKAINYAQNFDDKIIVEECLNDFRELNISLFRTGKEIKVSAIEEVCCPKFYGFKEKYQEELTRKVPADLDKNQKEKIKRLSTLAYKTLDLQGVVRMDFFLANEQIYLNEINTIPGSLAFYLWRSEGISFSKLLSLNIDNAINNFCTKQNLNYEYKSNVLKDLTKIDKIIEK